MKKHSIIFTALVLIGMLAIAGCSRQIAPTATAAPATPVAPAGSPTDTPQAALPSLPATIDRAIHLDPAVTQDPDSLTVSSLVYDGLTRLDAAGNLQPALATGWTMSDDQLDYVVTLRQNVSFSSGRPFDADAVLANFNRWFDKADALHGAQDYPGWTQFFLGYKGEADSEGVAVSPFDGIEKVDDHTVLIHLNRPDPKLLQNLAQASFDILDPTVIAAQGKATGTSAQSVSGTGAYRVSSWTDGGLALTPNPDYWGGAPAQGLTLAWK